MRRQDRKISVEEAIEILKKGEYGFLATVSADSKPYIIPISYSYLDNYIYFHSALEGKKIDNIKNNNKISFSVVGDTKLLPDKFATIYESVIVEGRVYEVTANEKQIALESLLYKYSPEHIDSGLKYTEKLFNKTLVFKIVIDEITGKARKK
jgi:nitroimidazol reductase NimA-like FMN-containing flavoprotein (pyridoxamine 5'-phosphate oxidase superfamily)